MNYERLILEKTGDIAVLTINRPNVYNALDHETWAELHDAVRALETDISLRAVVITGAGGKSFASGGDLNELRDRTIIEQIYVQSGPILNEIHNMRKPVIAAIEGYALGGGCELAMACDIRVAGRQSKFGQTETGLGIIPGAGATQRLHRLVGMGMAKYLIFTGEIISAEEALRIGLIEKIVDPGQALNAAVELARKIAEKAPIAVSLAKVAINVGTNIDLNSGLYLERFSQAIAMATEDRVEGVSAFLEKRKPKFKGY